MKKLFVLFAVSFLLLAGLVACSPKAPEQGEDPVQEGYEIALVTDVGTIDDKSFNQGSWEGVVKYAQENGKTYQYYQPQGETTADYLAAIELAIDGGAKLVVTPGFMFEPAIYEAQDLYPEISFILIDGSPRNEDYTDFKLNDNVYSVFYAEEQAGFLAGYASVKEGFTNLGYMGGMAVPAVVRFGHGFVQGAEAAAKEDGVQVEVRYEYLNSFAPDINHTTKAEAWYTEGVDVIFVAAGGAGLSVFPAAEQAGKKAIGVDVDQSNLSDAVVTSALKDLTGSVYDGVKAFYDGTFQGGQSVVLTAADHRVGLPEDLSSFETFNKEMYDSIYAKLVSGEIVVIKDSSKVVDLVLENVKVTLIGAE